MWILQSLPITHQTLLLAVILGFILLAGLCLSARSFTQLLEFLARRGSSGGAPKTGKRHQQTTSSTDEDKG